MIATEVRCYRIGSSAKRAAGNWWASPAAEALLNSRRLLLNCN